VGFDIWPVLLRTIPSSVSIGNGVARGRYFLRIILKYLGHMVDSQLPIAVYRQVPQNRRSAIRRSLLPTAATLAWL